VGKLCLHRKLLNEVKRIISTKLKIQWTTRSNSRDVESSMGKLIQGCCGSRVMECCEKPHSKVLECFIEVNIGYEYLRKVVSNRTHRLDCILARWKLAGKCSVDGTIV
jgi:hypothetical protein